MTNAPYSYFYRVDLDVSYYDYNNDDIVTKTFIFTNKESRDSLNASRYWPILKSIGNINLSSGEILPTSSIGTISIDNSIGSFGANRKFLDILEIYTPIEQEVTIYVGYHDNDSDNAATVEVIATGVVQDFTATIGESESTLTFSVRTALLKQAIMTLDAASTVENMETLPTSSQGRVIPLCIGNSSYVTPVRISADGSDTPKWAYGTAFSGYKRNYDPSLWTKTDEQVWQPITLGDADYKTAGGFASAGQFALNAWLAQAYKIIDDEGLYTGVELRAKGSGSGTPQTSNLTVFILRYDKNTNNVLEQVATGRVALGNYNASNAAGTADFAVRVSFDNPVFLTPGIAGNYEYALGYLATDLALNYYSTSVKGFIKSAADSAGGTEWKVTSGNNALRCILLSCVATYNYIESGADVAGKTFSSVELAQATEGAGQLNPIFDNFPLVVQHSGCTEYGSATIRPTEYQIADLDAEWDGATFVDQARWDTTRYATEYSRFLTYQGGVRSRKVTGMVFDSRATFSDIVTTFCRAAACRVGVLSSGKLFIYPWGTTRDAVVEIPPEDVTPINWTRSDASTVVNSVFVNAGLNPLASGRSFENELRDGRSSKGYFYNYDYSSANNEVVEELTKESRALFGDRAASDSNVPLAILDQSVLGGVLASTSPDTYQSGGVLAEYLITKFDKPTETATIVIPYNATYKVLEMFDVIKFAHPEFGAYRGTDPDQKNYPYTSGGTTAQVDAKASYELTRCKTYRALIESKSYILPSDHAPAIQLTVTILNNYPKDPT